MVKREVQNNQHPQQIQPNKIRSTPHNSKRKNWKLAISTINVRTLKTKEKLTGVKQAVKKVNVDIYNRNGRSEKRRRNTTKENQKNKKDK